MLWISRNRNAVTPLVERLEQDVPCVELDAGSRLTRFVATALNRGLDRTARERHRILDRMWTIRALGRLGDRSAGPAIRPFLNDPHERLRTETAKALAQLGVDSVEYGTFAESK